MTCSVVTEKPGVPVSEMKEWGHPAVIVEFPSKPRFIGAVVQRGEGDLIIVLGPAGDSWKNGANLTGLRVRILQSGATIRID